MKTVMIQEVEITPEKLAELFCEMDADMQAEFFNRCYSIFQSWEDDGGSSTLQMFNIMHSSKLDAGECFIEHLWEERME